MSTAQNCGSGCMFNNARFAVDGIVKREMIRVGVCVTVAHVVCQIMTLLVLVSKDSSSTLAIGMQVSV